MKTRPHPAVCTVASGSAASSTRAQRFCCILTAHVHELHEPVFYLVMNPPFSGAKGDADVGEMASSRTWILQTIHSTISDINSVGDHNNLSIDRAKVLKWLVELVYRDLVAKEVAGELEH